MHTKTLLLTQSDQMALIDILLQLKNVIVQPKLESDPRFTTQRLVSDLCHCCQGIMTDAATTISFTAMPAELRLKTYRHVIDAILRDWSCDDSVQYTLTCINKKRAYAPDETPTWPALLLLPARYIPNNHLRHFRDVPLYYVCHEARVETIKILGSPDRLAIPFDRVSDTLHVQIQDYSALHVHANYLPGEDESIDILNELATIVVGKFPCMPADFLKRIHKLKISFPGLFSRPLERVQRPSTSRHCLAACHGRPPDKL
jgi:hypothetical protein